MRLSLIIALWGALAGLTSCGNGPLDAIDLAPSSIDSGLIAHYTFDEGSGTGLVDHSGNKRDGVLTGGQWITDGAFAGALRFPGTANDHGDVNSFPNAPESFSVSAWARATIPTTDDDETLLSTEIPFQGGWELNLNRHTAGIGIHAGYWDTVAMAYVFWECTCLPQAEWVHVAFLRDARDQTLSVYLDGVLRGKVPAPNPISPGEPQLYVGHWQGNARYFNGDLDDVVVYARALVPEEVVELGSESPADQR
jgi:hypothetical protein